MGCDNNLKRCHEYIEALEEERRKIQVFHRELPLCFDLVTQAICACRQQLSATENNNNNNINSPNRQSECSVQTTASEESPPVFEEFIPIKPISSSDEEDSDEEERRSPSQIDSPKDTKSDWLRSAQLWNQTPDQPLNKQDGCVTKSSLTEGMKNSGGAFKPFRGEIKKGGGAASNSLTKSLRTVPPVAADTCTTTAARSSGSGRGGEGSRRVEKDGDVLQRKTRRCWSPELHRRFLQALEQLGGAHVATPKQIRDLMKVEGLTNDEVKSHLQKYRLHARRPTSGGSNTSVRSNNTNGDPQAPQFVLVGGIWVQPPDYAGAPATTSSSGGDGDATTNKIYKPAAAIPPSSSASATGMQLKGVNSGSRGSHTDSGRCFSSPTTSSSTHTTTASPVF